MDETEHWKQEAMKWKKIAMKQKGQIDTMGTTLDKLMDSNDSIIKEYVSCKDQLKLSIDSIIKFKEGIEEQTTNQDGSSKSNELRDIKYYFYGMFQEWYDNHLKIKNNKQK